MTLARALGVPIAEPLLMRSWIAADPFASPANTAAFLDEVDRIRASGVELGLLAGTLPLVHGRRTPGVAVQLQRGAAAAGAARARQASLRNVPRSLSGEFRLLDLAGEGLPGIVAPLGDALH